MRGAGAYRLVRCPRLAARDVPEVPLAERIIHLYMCQALSTYRIAGKVGIRRRRVTRVLRTAGVAVKPKGAGRPRRDRESGPFPEPVLAYLYLRQRLTCAQISVLTGIPARTVRDRLRGYGVRMRTRGRGNREDRLAISPGVLADVYLRAGLPSEEIGRILGVSRRVVLRTAHDEGMPVRMGGSVRKVLRAAGVALRPAGGRSPFLRKWRSSARRTRTSQPPGGGSA